VSGGTCSRESVTILPSGGRWGASVMGWGERWFADSLRKKGVIVLLKVRKTQEGRGGGLNFGFFFFS